MDHPIRNMVDNILSNKEAEALTDFETAIADKLHDSLESRKQEIASDLGESSVTDKFMQVANFVGDVVTGEYARKMMEPKKDDKAPKNEPAQKPQQSPASKTEPAKPVKK